MIGDMTARSCMAARPGHCRGPWGYPPPGHDAIGLLGHVYHLLGDYRQAMDVLRQKRDVLQGELLQAALRPASGSLACAPVPGWSIAWPSSGNLPRGSPVVQKASVLPRRPLTQRALSAAYISVGRAAPPQRRPPSGHPDVRTCLALCQAANFALFFPGSPRP